MLFGPSRFAFISVVYVLLGVFDIAFAQAAGDAISALSAAGLKCTTLQGPGGPDERTSFCGASQRQSSRTLSLQFVIEYGGSAFGRTTKRIDDAPGDKLTLEENGDLSWKELDTGASRKMRTKTIIILKTLKQFSYEISNIYQLLELSDKIVMKTTITNDKPSYYYGGLTHREGYRIGGKEVIELVQAKDAQVGVLGGPLKQVIVSLLMQRNSN